MKKGKHKSLNKFRTKIWPSVVGNIFIFLVSTVVILLVLAFQVVEIIMTKTGQVELQLKMVYNSCMEEEHPETFQNFAQDMFMKVSGISGIRLLEVVDDDTKPLFNPIYVEGHQIKNIEGYGSTLGQEDIILIAEDGTCNFSELEGELAVKIVKTMLKQAVLEDDNAYILGDLQDLPDEVIFDILRENGIEIDSIDDLKEIDNIDDWLSLGVWEEQSEDKNGQMSSSDDIMFSIPIWQAIPIGQREMFGRNQDNRIIAFRSSVIVYQRDVDILILSMTLLMTLILIILIWNITSTTRVVRQQRQLLHALYTDVQSGGHNMLYLEDKSVSLIRRAKNRRYALVSIGMDKYSSFCTCYGAAEMELLMEFLYKHFTKNCSRQEIVSATDKAVFALLLSYQSNEELEQRVLGMVQAAKNARPEQNLVFSIGIYEVVGKEDISTQYHYASVARETVPEDNALRLQWFDSKMLEEHLWIHKVENDMERALAAHEFQVYLQPKYSTKDETIAGAEALVRWIHPEEGLVPPGRFIPIFEKNGFILRLDDYMISEVARLQAHWIAEGKHVVPISVNVSRAHFTRKDLAEHICDLIDRFQVPHKVIELELTESAFFDDKEILIDTVNKLKKAGFEISMDDFGAGYSSLNSLKELPLDVLKLDAEFFRGEDKDGRGDLIVSEAIDLAKKLDMKIVAEGIETREQVDALAAKDCDLIQGYYFAKPLPVDEFVRRVFG